MRQIIFLILISSFLSGCTQTPLGVYDFDSCVEAGNPVLESYPRQCKDGNRTFVEQSSVKPIPCLESQRNADACIEIYKPVCAKVNIQCITTPCNPVYETYSNSCFACQNDLVESFTNGACDEQT